VVEWVEEWVVEWVWVEWVVVEWVVVVVVEWVVVEWVGGGGGVGVVSGCGIRSGSMGGVSM
jgi:hypothetical protein